LHEDDGALEDIKLALKLNPKDFFAHKIQYQIYKRLIEISELNRERKLSNDEYGFENDASDDDEDEDEDEDNKIKKQYLKLCAKEALYGINNIEL
jgi:hypothetical protein